MNTIFLLGAGFSADISNGLVPNTNKIKEEINKLLDENIKSIYGFEKDDFEIALTRLDVDLSPNYTKFDSLKNGDKEKEFSRKLEEYHIPKDELFKIREKISFKISELFKLKDEDILISKTSDIFVEKILRKDDVVLTTNYDTFLENLLGPNKWSYHGGYGEVMKWKGVNDPNKNSKLNNIRIYKIHGCPAFRKVEMFNMKDDEYRKGDVKLSIKKEYFPKFDSNLGYVSDEGPYLILPSFIKGIEFASMSDLYREVFSEIKNKDHLIIIGSRLRKEDYMLWLMLSHFRSSQKIKIDIIDPEAADLKEKIVETLRIPEKNINLLPGTLSEQIDVLERLI
jgi:hypothetical protein